MKKLILLIVAIGLVATAATAGVSPDDFRSASKIVPEKDTLTTNKVGSLDCSGAIEIALDNVYLGTNVGATNNVSTYGCSFWDESGGEVVYHIFFSEPTMFTANITPDGCDLDMAVLDQCDEDLGCLIVVDTGVVTTAPISGDIYFVIDGYNGAECSFTFDINSVVAPEPVNFCDALDDVFGGYFEGDTCTGENNISSEACGVYTEDGLEYYYEIFMPAGSSFTADVTNTADGAIWVFDACAAPYNCLAYADATFTGGTEVVSYSNVTPNDMWVYLVVDSYGAGSCGTYVMNFAASGGAVANEEVTFGSMKATFR